VKIFLWITKESGTIMNAEDTHTIYSLSSSSVKEVFEFVHKGQSHNIEEVVNNHNDIQNFEGLDRFVKNVGFMDAASASSFKLKINKAYQLPKRVPGSRRSHSIALHLHNEP